MEEILALLFQKLASDVHQGKILVWVHQAHQKYFLLQTVMDINLMDGLLNMEKNTTI